jgi:glutaredoxin
VFTLTIYDGDSTTHTFTDKANKGMFFFSGGVEKPVLASIQHPTMTQPLFFYLEGSEISINVNATRPEASIIKGSRTNSEYRYLMERYYGSAEPGAFLRQYVKENAGSIFTPFVLYRQMTNIDEGTVRQLIGQIGEEGRHTYHYTLLRRWLRETPAVSEGSEMPDFAYLDGNKVRRTFAESRNQEGYTLLQFSATWCDRCQQQREKAEKALAGKEVQTLVINIDDNPNGWDAHYLQQLSVNHIPYLILVDAQGVVVARDIQAWELKKVKIER